ncbi:MAG: hypothetical protein ACTSP4_10130, partial [Candidatus Hodarchaeales archaeon]
MSKSDEIRNWVYSNYQKLENKYPDSSIMVTRKKNFLFFKRWQIKIYDNAGDAMKAKLEMYQNGLIGPDDAVIISFKTTGE